MASSIPDVVHGFPSLRDVSGAEIEGEDRGLLVVRPPAQVVYMSPRVRALIDLALGRTSDGERCGDLNATMGPILSELCTNLRAAFTGWAAPPSITCVRSAWGQFVLCAYWLESPDVEDSGLVGVTIERHESLSMRLLRAMNAHGLTERQRELCLLLFDGRSIPAVAKQLRVSRHTVVDHLKKIYLKLDVHSRDELRSKLEGEWTA